MKLLRHMVSLWTFIGILGGASASLAADSPNPAGDKAAAPTKVAAVAKEAPKDIVLKGDAKCTTCHDENDSPQALAIGKTRHGVTADSRAPTCTSCHGESEAHQKEAGRGDKKPPMPDVTFSAKTQSTAQARSGACLSCHEKDRARMHWAGSQHESRDVVCTSCHNIHTGKDRVLSKATQSEVCFACHKTERAQTLRVSTHPLAAGKMGCSDCHNPHGSTGPKLLAKNTVNETCWTCHAEKRGPFLWEHPPSNDDCMNCHTPHGSTNQALLKGRAPWLCQQCHSDGPPHPGNVYSAANLPGGAVANVNTAVGMNTNNKCASATGTTTRAGITCTGTVTGSQNTVTGALGAAAVTNPLTGSLISQNNPSPQMAFRACANCHTQVHGSNHPGGYRLLR